jgi:hypothetical protein
MAGDGDVGQFFELIGIVPGGGDDGSVVELDAFEGFAGGLGESGNGKDRDESKQGRKKTEARKHGLFLLSVKGDLERR